MWKKPTFKSLVFVGVWFVLGALTCVASVIEMRAAAVALSTVLLFSLCLVGGYLYSKFEQSFAIEQSEDKGEALEQYMVTDKDLESL